MEKIVKRFFDLMLALILFIPVSLVLICGIIFVKAVSPEASPIFKQERVGYKNKLFALYKLRSMTNERDENGELLPDEVRLKNWGKIVRKTNMDELFQIWNILKGEMSFIGPRPILAKEMLVMTVAEQQERQSMRPGITGWEAVHEGESENRRQMAEFDLYYVRNWNLKLDWLVFYKTFAIVLGCQRPVDSVRAPKMTDDQIVDRKG
ncbi:sugar transferase [Bacteroides eggerthii]|jgi:lipopolysaccharide/colanic/teichoic acid biosynthesis glycosyltransferase|uniref:Putative UDP-galactose phosphate transferase n=1 Tax=Bacteroides eggerthii TaxID=28111 RepID=A0A380YKL1_9BACE|nr:sugar transferase [Bacteroides eggerthii]EEC52943.1 bacterial sugar transferase [Bacteroides eggerthii DSM 20697]QRQ47778.1 sugar transferase [Bacteroides eggerthii]UWN86673.1 sugar transferase [Bacteroides eggerthii]SUV29053.1 putative UDP-galactose phosphate transferase [Bacteroides eggerthii]